MYNGKRVRSLVGHEGGVWCSQLSFDASVLVTGSTDRRYLSCSFPIRMFDMIISFWIIAPTCFNNLQANLTWRKLNICIDVTTMFT